MEAEIKVTKKVNIKYLEICVSPRYYEDGTIKNPGETNWHSMNEDGSGVPMVVENKEYYEKIWGEDTFEKSYEKSTWRVIVDVDSGNIMDWPKGYCISVGWKVVDQGYYALYDDNMNLITDYQGYVPDCLGIDDNSYGDYFEFHTDENGHIENWHSEDILTDTNFFKDDD